MKKLLIALSISVLVFFATDWQGWQPVNYNSVYVPAEMEEERDGVDSESAPASKSQSNNPPRAPENNIQIPTVTTAAPVSPDQEQAKQSAVVTKPPVPAPAPVQSAPAAPKNSAQEMLGYINSERAKVKLPPLTLNAKLSEGAYLKSKDMAENGYFEHNSPTYGTPFAMMKSLDISYRNAAENIAYHQSVLSAHNAFMNSPGHRANILNPAFRKLGLGIYKNGADIYVTQWFTD